MLKVEKKYDPLFRGPQRHWFWDVDYVSDEALQGLKFYKYSSIDKRTLTKPITQSPLSNYVLRHYWEFATTLFPRWMAPNLITLLGFVWVLANIAIMLIYTPDMVTQGPGWIYFSFALGLWMYSTFDNVDGKQARRTGSSSPLGELFDHGVDSLNAAFGSMIQAAGIGMGLSWGTVTIVGVTTIVFFFSTWENYYTGSLYLGYINGPTEGLVIACIMLCMSGIFGHEIWWRPISTSAPFLSSLFPETWALASVLLFGLVFLMITTQIPVSVWRVYEACRSKGLSFRRAMWGTVPFLWFVGGVVGWLGSPLSGVLEEGHLVLFLSTTGVIFGRIATLIILSHVTHQPYPTFSHLLIPLILGTTLVNAPFLFGISPILTPEGEYYYLVAFFLWAVGSYLHWATVVIDRFCTHLGIECFRIPYKKAAHV
ncbi:hypothetical protein HDV00_002359 [Rhizophlyctis rosea]|nr:hypothetical protein HDV00_002359 [Rhizophlyctis rosea]